MEPKLTNRKEHEMFIESMLQTSADIHYHHLNTRSFAEHKALNYAYKALDGLTDSICEKLIGYAGRYNGTKIVTPSCKLMELSDCIDKLGRDLKTMASKNKWDDLVNTADEIIGISPQLKYLLTLS